MCQQKLTLRHASWLDSTQSFPHVIQFTSFSTNSMWLAHTSTKSHQLPHSMPAYYMLAWQTPPLHLCQHPCHHRTPHHHCTPCLHCLHCLPLLPLVPQSPSSPYLKPAANTTSFLALPLSHVNNVMHNIHNYLPIEPLVWTTCSLWPHMTIIPVHSFIISLVLDLLHLF